MCVYKTVSWGTSVVVQWVGLRAPNAGGAWVRSLVGEPDPTCMPQQKSLHAATKSLHAATKKAECCN